MCFARSPRWYEINVKVNRLGEFNGKSIASHLLFRNLLGGRSHLLSYVANICLYDKHKVPENFEEMKRKLVLEEALDIRVFPFISDLFF